MKISIRTLMALTSGGLVLAATVTVLAITFGASRDNTYGLLNDRMVLLLHAIEREVLDDLGAAEDLVNGIAARLQAEPAVADDPQRLQSLLASALAVVPEADVVLIWDKELVRRGVYRDEAGRISPARTQPHPAAQTRGFLAQAAGDGQPSWGPPVVQGGVSYLNVARRVDLGEGREVFIGAAVSIGEFSRLMDAIGARYGATPFILYDDEVIAHPALAGRSAASGPPTVRIADLADPALSGLAAATPVEFMAEARAEGADVVRIESGEGKVYYALLGELRSFGPVPWTIGAYSEAESIRQTISRLTASGIAGLAVTLIAVIAAILLGGYIARPVRRLADTAAGVASMNFHDLPAPRPSPIREIDEQGRAFAIMLDGLRVFATYVPRALVSRLIALGRDGNYPSETREVTVMFTDIVGFTTMSDRMGAEETAAFLNRHFALLAGCIRDEGGTIDKYIGDAVMAFWGAPDMQPDHALRALRTACAIARTVSADNARRARKGLRPVRMRIGIHSGPVVVGNIGAPERVNFTIVGATVNVAQRLESLGHEIATTDDVTIIASAETVARAGLSEGILAIGAHRLAGVPEEVTAFRVMPQDGELPAAAASLPLDIGAVRAG